MNRIARIASALTLIAVVSGCATANNRNPQDPFERYNRSMFIFNDTLDRVAVKPAATAYQKIVPQFVQTGVGNFFGNLGDVWTGVNDMLQGKFEDGLNDFMRVAVNSTFGIGGLIDIGSEAGIRKHREDFGQTLGVWGVRAGPYVVLPVLGSSTLRDTLATPLDIAGDPWSYKRPIGWRNTGTVLRGVDLRASVLGASSLIEAAAVDRYEFIRDAYLQRRQSKIDDNRGSQLKQDKSDAADDASPATESGTGKAPPPDKPTTPESAKPPAVPVSMRIDERGPAVTTADNVEISMSSEAIPKQLTIGAD